MRPLIIGWLVSPHDLVRVKFASYDATMLRYYLCWRFFAIVSLSTNHRCQLYLLELVEYFWYNQKMNLNIPVPGDVGVVVLVINGYYILV